MGETQGSEISEGTQRGKDEDFRREEERKRRNVKRPGGNGLGHLGG